MVNEWKDLGDGVLAEFCFVRFDIAGHSQIARNRPKEKVSTTLDRFESLLNERICDSAGQLWSWHGDGGLAAFLGKDATERAVACALRIIRELGSFNRMENLVEDEIMVRIAIHVGTAKYREQAGRIHSADINFVFNMGNQFAFPNDVCISRDAYAELGQLARRKFKEVGTFQQKQIYSMQGKIRDKALLHVDHRELPKREETLNRHFHKELRIFSTTADNYFGTTDVLPVIRKKLKSGCKIRILLLHPDSPFMGDRERQERTHFAERQRASIANIKELNKEFPQQIELRLFDCSPTCQSLIIDDCMAFIAINVYGSTGTADFPCVEIINGPDTKELFAKFTLAFQTLWEESKR